MTPYEVARKLFDARRKGWPYRTLPRTSQYVLTNTYNDDSLCVEWRWDFDANRVRKPIRTPRAFIRLWPDNRLQINTPPSVFLGAFNRALQFVSQTNLLLRPDRSVKTDATHVIQLDYWWASPQEWWVVQLPGGEKRQNLDWIATRDLAKSYATPFKESVELAYPYNPAEAVSLKPVLTRTWDPDKRKEYLQLRRDLRKQIKLRTLIGAIQPTWAENRTAADFAGALQANKKLSAKAAANQLDPVSHETYALLAEAALPSSAHYLFHKQNRQATDKFVIERMNLAIHRHSETLRLSLGAVVYSETGLSSVSAKSNDSNLVVQPPDGL